MIAADAVVGEEGPWTASGTPGLHRAALAA